MPWIISPAGLKIQRIGSKEIGLVVNIVGTEEFSSFGA